MAERPARVILKPVSRRRGGLKTPTDAADGPTSENPAPFSAGLCTPPSGGVFTFQAGGQSEAGIMPADADARLAKEQSDASRIANEYHEILVQKDSLIAQLRSGLENSRESLRRAWTAQATTDAQKDAFESEAARLRKEKEWLKDRYEGVLRVKDSKDGDHERQLREIVAWKDKASAWESELQKSTNKVLEVETLNKLLQQENAEHKKQMQEMDAVCGENAFAKDDLEAAQADFETIFRDLGPGLTVKDYIEHVRELEAGRVGRAASPATTELQAEPSRERHNEVLSTSLGDELQQKEFNSDTGSGSSGDANEDLGLLDASLQDPAPEHGAKAELDSWFSAWVDETTAVAEKDRLLAEKTDECEALKKELADKIGTESEPEEHRAVVELYTDTALNAMAQDDKLKELAANLDFTKLQLTRAVKKHADSAKCSEEAEEAKKELQQNLQSTEKLLAESRERLEAANKESELKDAQLQDQKEKLRAQEGDIDKWKREATSVTSESEMQKVRIMELKKELKAQQSIVAQLKGENKSHEARIKSGSDESEIQKARIVELEEESKSQQSTVEQIRLGNKSYEAKIKSQSDESDKQKARITELEEELKSQQLTVEKLMEENKSQEARIKSQSNSLDAGFNRNRANYFAAQRANTSLKQTEQKLKKAEKDIGDLKSRLNQSQYGSLESQKKCTDLEAKLDASKQEVDGLNQELEEASATQLKIENELETMLDNKSKVENELAKMCQSKSMVDNEVEQVNHGKMQLELKLNELRTDLRQGESNVDKLSSTLFVMSQIFPETDEELKQQLDNATSQVGSIKGELAALSEPPTLAENTSSFRKPPQPEIIVPEIKVANLSFWHRHTWWMSLILFLALLYSTVASVSLAQDKSLWITANDYARQRLVDLRSGYETDTLSVSFLLTMAHFVGVVFLRLG